MIFSIHCNSKFGIRSLAQLGVPHFTIVRRILGGYSCGLLNEKVKIFRNRLIPHFENSKIEKTEPRTKFPSYYIEENDSSRLCQSE